MFIRLFILSTIIFFYTSIANAQGDQKQKIQSEQFGSWFYRCVHASKPKNAKRCEVVQVAQTRQGKETINLLTVSLSKLRQKKKKNVKTVITILTPLNVFLPAGLKLKVGKSKANKLTYRNCNKAGCWIQHFMNAKLLRQLSRGATAEAKLKLINGQNLNIRFSLKGLNAALKQLKKG